MGRIKPIEPGACFGRWTVLHVSETRSGDGCLKYVSRCQCGTVRNINSSKLRSGDSRSCGCLRTENIVKAVKKHGLEGTKEYQCWVNMIRRCSDSRDVAYKSYGGRGIKVCDEWKDVSKFYADMGQAPTKKHEIDRINNDKGYHPDNCRWVTASENCCNTSRSRTWFLNGLIFKSHVKAAEHFKVRPETIRSWCLGKYKNGKQITPPRYLCFADNPICDL
jgi:hypothetical protein